MLKESFDSIAAIERELTTIITASRGPVWAEPASPDEVVHPLGEVKKPKVQQSVSKDDDFANLSWTGEGDCMVPSTYIKLAPNEKIISSTSNLYPLTFCDILWTILTCAYYYFKYLRHKRQSRQGFVLTTHRLIVMELVRDDGGCCSLCCLANLLCCCPTVRGLNVRSLFPREVSAGYVRREGLIISGRVLTDRGAIELSFDIVNPCECCGKAGKAETENMEQIVDRLNFLKRMTCTTQRAASQINAEEMQHVLQEMALPDAKEGETLDEVALEPFEKQIMPLLETGETVLARFNGKIYEDGVSQCFMASCFCCIPCCTNANAWYPACPLLFTCGIAPKFAKEAIIVTNKTVYCVQDNSNEPSNFLCCRPPDSVESGTSVCYNYWKVKNYAVFWAPLMALNGTELDTALFGKENCQTRFFYKTWIGDQCCPMLKSRATVRILLESIQNCITLSATHIDMTRPIREDLNIVRFRKSVSIVQNALIKTFEAGPEVVEVKEEQEEGETNSETVVLNESLNPVHVHTEQPKAQAMV